MEQLKMETPRTAGVVAVIEITAARGAGTDMDPVRIVTQYWSFDGVLLAEKDICDECKRVEWRPLEARTDVGEKENSRPIPDGWIAVIMRVVNNPKLSRIFCGAPCAVAYLQRSAALPKAMTT